jgi:hypothetical protein
VIPGRADKNPGVENVGNVLGWKEWRVAKFWNRAVMGPGCWIWVGATFNTAYGAVRIRLGRGMYTKVGAHRVAWMLTFGAIPDGKQVCHACDTPACVNPSHLWIGTMSQNIRDCVAKGRHESTRRKGWTHCRRGHPFTGDNLSTDRRGRRCCLACKRIRNNKAYLLKAGGRTR